MKPTNIGCLDFLAEDPSSQISRYTEEQQKKCYSILRECAKHHILILKYGACIIVIEARKLMTFAYSFCKIKNEFSLA